MLTLPYFVLIVTMKCSSAGTPAFSLTLSAVISSPLSRYRPSATFSRFTALSCTLFTVSPLTTAAGAEGVAVLLVATDGFGDTSVRFFVVTATGFCVGTAVIFESSVIVVTVDSGVGRGVRISSSFTGPFIINGRPSASAARSRAIIVAGLK